LTIGIGKNYFADMALAYMIYKLSCYYNPQAEFDLAPGSTIFFIAQSKTHTLAKKVVFDQFSERLRLSPYFQKNFKFDPGVRSELRFPNQIVVLPVGGNDTAALGMNVFGGVIDELNFMARTKDSVETRFTGEDEYDQAERLYSTIIRRMKSRFMQKGKIPGKLMLISSRNYPDDFTDRKMQEAEHDKSIFVMSYSQWDALPADRFCGDKFLIEVGNELKQSRILVSMEDAMEETDVIEVPVEYRTEFERDMDAALKDLGGIATGTKSPFIPYREAMQLARDKFSALTQDRQLFLHDEIYMPDFEEFSDLVSDEYIEEVLLDKSVVFAAHIDVGLSGDALGLALGHVSGYKNLPSTRFFDNRSNTFVEVTDIIAPIYQIDGALRIKSRAGEEVDLEAVRDLVMYIKSKLRLDWCTMDSYQAPMFYQSFRKARIRSGVLSVDTSLAPYTEVKLAVKDERILLPSHPTLAKELREIERDIEKGKVDHPSSGSFLGGTLVTTDKGPQTLQALANCGEDVTVRTRNHDGSTEWTVGLKPRITGYKTGFVDVELDNGRVERCTPEHLWLLADGSYKRADELAEGAVLFSIRLRNIRKLKVVSVKHVKLPEPVPTYDISVLDTENFRLASGAFVHNSKDVADSVAGTVFILYSKVARFGRGKRSSGLTESREAPPREETVRPVRKVRLSRQTEQAKTVKAVII